MVGRVRGLSRVGLAGMMLAAVALLVAARFMGGGSVGPAATATPSDTGIVARASPTVSPAPTPAATPLPTASPSATASPTPTVSPSPTPAPTRTYTVKAGDSLYGIAAKFGTTVAILQSLNNITDASRIGIGQVLKIP
jgi:LysM repeat protein